MFVYYARDNDFVFVDHVLTGGYVFALNGAFAVAPFQNKIAPACWFRECAEAKRFLAADGWTNKAAIRQRYYFVNDSDWLIVAN